MDQHVRELYQSSSEDGSRGHFHEVIALHETKELQWKEIRQKASELPKGWYELSRLSAQDRIDFTRDFWLSKLPFQPKLSQFLTQFFQKLDDIAIFLVQKKFDDPFESHLIYSLKNDEGYFRGLSPASEQKILALKNAFPNFILPDDFIRFLQIHDGFCKATDTGIISSAHIPETFTSFQMLLEQENVTSGNRPVDPKTLIPFYESFGMPFFQCFWAEWYPENEMGNVYYSGLTKSISNVKCRDPVTENMAFATFLDWLMFYLETIE